ncbi:hypothetical protein C1752_02083 [Acaryochloris thomasi RCC1774]|uniref:SnoaL-like domain-containing protein n=1 Tax=Acaryochloris thomasi RCC1774 TaxID=1764569 RepID=A0A2W1JK61_9CYAN|nr:hypothetical protein [Acaryochloris thomasi]PZD73616.1 hypothetical protein C1752_02083 [Acaryochloris thomasi RCC1774]
MLETGLLVSTVQQGYNWLKIWHEEQATPPHLPRNVLLTFQRFKKAYDTKDLKILASVISASYQGDLFGVSTKSEYLEVQRSVFNSLPWGAYPCLTVNLYSITEDTNEEFAAIIDTQSMATVLGIPVLTYDSAPVRCKLRANNGLWSVTEMFVERQLL